MSLTQARTTHSAFRLCAHVAIVALAGTLGISLPVAAQVLPGPGIGSGWDDSTGNEGHPQTVPTREAALGANARVRQVIYFDVDGDGLDDELVTTRAASESNTHCEDTPVGSPDCGWGLVFLKRSASGWTPFDVAPTYTQTTESWVGGFRVGGSNILVVDLRSHSEDGTGPLLAHGYAILTWRAGALYLLHEGISAHSGGPLYLTGDPDGVRFSDDRGCTQMVRPGGGTVAVDRQWQCPGGRRGRRR